MTTTVEVELAEDLSIRDFRLEVAYTAARLNALEETRHLAKDFEEASHRFSMLEDERATFDVQRVETQALVEIADDAWDDTMHALERRLLDHCGHDTDHPLYRRYFAEIPSQVTRLSYWAEAMISKDLEAELAGEDILELQRFGDRLEDTRLPLEAALRERTRLEVELAKFDNRSALAKQLANKLRRITLANLEEIAVARDRGPEWCARFFRTANVHLDTIDGDGVGNRPAPVNGQLEDRASEA